jgi:phytoene dehydrogenase-like protein
MARIVVVGAGVAGLAAAARLSKLGHRVVMVERRGQVGGAVGQVEADGFCWDGGPTSTALPAVLRDLFRKSGRPLERYLDLTMRAVARRHVFADGSIVDLPTGSRGAQTRAVDAGLGSGAGAAWTAFVDSQADVWQSLRLQVLDDPVGGARLGERPVAAAIGGPGSLERLTRRALHDERLRAMAVSSFVMAGSVARDVPAFAAVEPYVERTFGLWEPPGGMTALIDVLALRLEERGVDSRLETCATRLAWNARARAVVGVETDEATLIEADAVVCAIDARRALIELLDARAAPRARRVFEKATPAIPPAVVHLAIAGEVPALPPEVVLHGDPLLTLHTGGRAPAGHHAWTIHRRGSSSVDVVATLARRGIDVREQVVARVDRSPSDVVGELGGSPYGMAWDGYRAHAQRAALTSPVPGLHLIGASVHPGAGIAYAAWGAAHVAARIGPA